MESLKLENSKIIEALSLNGFSVTVDHYRYASIPNASKSVLLLDSKGKVSKRTFVCKQLLDRVDLDHFVKELDFNIHHYGGSTEVCVLDEDGGLVAKEFSKCSLQDAFEKRKGVNVALNKIINNNSLI